MKIRTFSAVTISRKPLLFTIAVVPALLLGSMKWHSASSAQATDKDLVNKTALTVTAGVPRAEVLPFSLSARGNIAAWQEAILSSETNGLRLKEVRVNIGDTVRAGDVLAVFASETIQADVAQARAALIEAEANSAAATANADRARVLQRSGAMSGQQINQYLTAEKTADAHVASAKAYLDSQMLRLQQTKLFAPDSGVISSRSASVGAVVNAGSELFRLVRGGRMEWRAELSSSELTNLRSGSTVKVKAPNGRVVTGRIRTIAPTVDTQTRYGLAYVDLPVDRSTNTPLKPGMFVSGEFDLGESPAKTLPQQAVIVRDGYSYVFRINSNHSVTQIKVRTGRCVGNRIEIIDGITETERFAFTGAGFLNDGDFIQEASALPTKPTGGSISVSNNNQAALHR